MAALARDPRSLETALARLTLGLLVLYVPLETLASLPRLVDPFYFVDLVAMVLLAWGARVSLAARPRPAPALLCAAYAWASANGWRATSWRWFAVGAGETLDYGRAELWMVTVASAIALGGFSLALFLVVRDEGFFRGPPALG